jgi:hypothetical protein
MSKLRAKAVLFAALVDESVPPKSIDDAAFTYFTSWLFSCVDKTSLPQLNVDPASQDEALVDRLQDDVALTEFISPLAESEGFDMKEVLDKVRYYIRLFVQKHAPTKT